MPMGSDVPDGGSKRWGVERAKGSQLVALVEIDEDRCPRPVTPTDPNGLSARHLWKGKIQKVGHGKLPP